MGAKRKNKHPKKSSFTNEGIMRKNKSMVVENEFKIAVTVIVFYNCQGDPAKGGRTGSFTVPAFDKLRLDSSFVKNN